MNARVVTQDRTLLNEETIVGLRVIKEAVRFSDPIYHQPEKIVITEELKRSVRSAHGAYQDWLLKDQEEQERQKEEAEKRRVISEKAEKERERLLKKKESLPKSEEDLNEQEEKARQDLSTADEVLKEASAKLEKVCETKPMSISAVTAAQKMIDTARDMRDDAMEKLDEIRMKQKSLYKTAQKLLDQALQSKHSTQGGGKGEPSKDSSEWKRKSVEKSKDNVKRVKKK